MAGYLDDAAATAEAFRGGWLHSGDAAVVHPDGRIELRDRFKDVIVSGGENISTIEVEQALARHPAVLDCAVVGIPDDHWGERPKAFVELRPGSEAPAEELTAFCREQLAGFKCPDTRGVLQPAAHGDGQGAEVRAAGARMGGPRAPHQLTAQNESGMDAPLLRRLRRSAMRPLIALLAGLLLAAPASAGPGSDLRAVIARAEQLRGLKTTHPLAVSTLDAAGLRRVVLRELARERRPRSDAAWDDALHLLGVLKR